MQEVIKIIERSPAVAGWITLIVIIFLLAAGAKLWIYKQAEERKLESQERLKTIELLRRND